jgi:hypothetical protein
VAGERTLVHACEFCVDLAGKGPSNRYHSISITGRTSTDPVRAFGMRVAQSIAASNDSTLIRK